MLEKRHAASFYQASAQVGAAFREWFFELREPAFLELAGLKPRPDLGAHAFSAPEGQAVFGQDESRAVKEPLGVAQDGLHFP